jgi:hypothetical protein
MRRVTPMLRCGRPLMPKPTLEITQDGRGGGMDYREGNHSIHFSWEFAMSPALALIFGPSTEGWDKNFPWAARRQVEVFNFVAEDVVRQKAEGCPFEVELSTGTITIMQFSAPRLIFTPRRKMPGMTSTDEPARAKVARGKSVVPKPPRPKQSAAFRKFIASVPPLYEHWREDQTYDVAAIKKMKPAERDQAVKILTGRDITWREVVALAAIKTPEAQAALEAASNHQSSIDTRLAAADCLNRQGRFADLETFLARQIRLLNLPADGLKRTLLLAERHPSETIKQALLWASWNTTDCAPHCAKLLLLLMGAAKEPFSKEIVEMLAKLGLHNSYFDRKAAFDLLCQKVKMEIDHSAAY